MNKKQSGFTLIELLVVISIISLLSSIVLATVKTARDKSKIARVQSDLIQIRNAIALMSADAGKWPNGCPVGSILPADQGAANEIPLTSNVSALLVRPPVGVTDATSNCEWKTAEANA